MPVAIASASYPQPHTVRFEVCPRWGKKGCGCAEDAPPHPTFDFGAEPPVPEEGQAPETRSQAQYMADCAAEALRLVAEPAAAAPELPDLAHLVGTAAPERSDHA